MYEYAPVDNCLDNAFDENLQVNYTKAAELAEYLVENGTQGIGIWNYGRISCAN